LKISLQVSLLCVEESFPEVVTYLLSIGDVRANVAGATSALLCSATLNHVGCLQALLAPNSPVNVNSLNQSSQSPLHSAAMSANLEAVQLLWSRGAVCTVRNSIGSTPLHYVCFNSDEDAVQAQMLGTFLEYGFSGGDSVINAQDSDGRTPALGSDLEYI
jgi:ankyrin repeat protein